MSYKLVLSYVTCLALVVTVSGCSSTARFLVGTDETPDELLVQRQKNLVIPKSTNMLPQPQQSGLTNVDLKKPYKPLLAPNTIINTKQYNADDQVLLSQIRSGLPTPPQNLPTLLEQDYREKITDKSWNILDWVLQRKQRIDPIVDAEREITNNREKSTSTVLPISIIDPAGHEKDMHIKKIPVNHR